MVKKLFHKFIIHKDDSSSSKCQKFYKKTRNIQNANFKHNNPRTYVAHVASNQGATLNEIDGYIGVGMYRIQVDVGQAILSV